MAVAAVVVVPVSVLALVAAVVVVAAVAVLALALVLSNKLSHRKAKHCQLQRVLLAIVYQSVWHPRPLLRRLRKT